MRGIGLHAATIACLLVLAASPAKAAESELVYDPTLSLTGDCSVSVIDPVPDPGLCPMPPGVPGVDHPPQAFSKPLAVTTDAYGNIFVGNANELGNGRIDIFSAEGKFITAIPNLFLPDALAVDSKGNLYVRSSGGIDRYAPTVYDQPGGDIEYGSPATVSGVDAGDLTLAVSPLNDHLYVNTGAVREFDSAAEGNKPLGVIIEGNATSAPLSSRGFAIDAAHGLIYVGRDDPIFAPPTETSVAVFDLAPPHSLLGVIDGSNIPAGRFEAWVTLAASEETGHVFIFDQENPQAVHEFTADGGYVGPVSFKFSPGTHLMKIAFDNGASSPNRGYLFVPSHPIGTGRVFAFGPPPEECAPVVEAVSFTNVTQGDAELHGTVNPCGVDTDYRFEYTSEESFQGEEFAGAEVVGEGQLPVGDVGVEVSAAATPLLPDTPYRFRLVAINAKGEDVGEATLFTHRSPVASPPCPNDAVRIDRSSALPDCRAYELVTPGDTGGRAPFGRLARLGDQFSIRTASPAGAKVSFVIEGGPIPGLEGTGGLSGDPYLATRGADGWQTASVGPEGTEAVRVLSGGVSPDQGYSFWQAVEGGTALIEESPTSYVRYPDGHSEPIGQGSLGIVDPTVRGRWITENGEHIVFVSEDNSSFETAIQLEPNAPPDRTEAIYDRTADGVTHVVSLLPGDVTPAAGQHAAYRGASSNGEGVAFSIEDTLYLRYRNEATYEVAEEAGYAGISAAGDRAFYLKDGDLFAFDVDGEETIRFTDAANVVPVNVSADGTTAYFVSPSVLTGEGPETLQNPNGDVPQASDENLYRSEEGALGFVATVTERDVNGTGGLRVGLGLWVDALSEDQIPREPSRTTPDGEVLLFESRATLTSYDTEDHTQVYRYDVAGETLECLSCNPTGEAAAGEASLQSLKLDTFGTEPHNAFGLVASLREDGRRAFFQSDERLVVDDTDGLQDVYEWKDQGVGDCTRPGGCIRLISSGSSSRDDYIFAVSDSGNDVFFTTADRLLPSVDPSETPSIYDARVNGGFPPPPAPPGECLGEACQPVVEPADAPTVASSTFQGPGNVPARARGRCPKGKRAVKRAGRRRCVPRNRHRDRPVGKRRNHR